MQDELRARFRERFIETARARLGRLRDPVAGSDSAFVARELHQLAGEAALLNYVACAKVATEAEQYARSGEARKCKSTFEALEKAIDAL